MALDLGYPATGDQADTLHQNMLQVRSALMQLAQLAHAHDTPELVEAGAVRAFRAAMRGASAQVVVNELRAPFCEEGILEPLNSIVPSRLGGATSGESQPRHTKRTHVR